MAAPYKLATPAAPAAAPWKMKGAPSAVGPADNSDLTPDSFMASQSPSAAAASPSALTPDTFMAQQPAAGATLPLAEEPGILSKAWKWANKGLVSGETIANTMGKAMPRPEDMLPGETMYQYLRRNQTSIDPDHPILAGIRAGLSGAAADAMDVASGFTSPSSIALASAGGVGRIPGAAGKVAKAAQLAGAGTYAVKGASDIADVASQSGNASPEDLQKMFFGGAQLAGGTAGAGDAVAGISPETGVSMMNRVIKPGIKNLERGQNPGQAVIDEGITGNSTKALGDNIKARYRMVGKQIGDVRDAASQPGPGQAPLTDATQAVTGPIHDAMTQAASDGRADLYQKLQNVKDQLTQHWAPDQNGALQPTGPRDLTKMTPQDLADVKGQVDNVTKWTGTPFDSELNQVKVAVRSNLRDLEEKAVPEVAPLNETYGGLKNAAKATWRTAAVHERQNAVSLPDYILTPAGVIAGAAMGHSLEGLAAGAGASLASRALGSPAVQTRAAQLLAHEGPAVGSSGAPIAAGVQARWKRKKL